MLIKILFLKILVVQIVLAAFCHSIKAQEKNDLLLKEPGSCLQCEEYERLLDDIQEEVNKCIGVNEAEIIESVRLPDLKNSDLKFRPEFSDRYNDILKRIDECKARIAWFDYFTINNHSIDSLNIRARKFLKNKFNISGVDNIITINDDNIISEVKKAKGLISGKKDLLETFELKVLIIEKDSDGLEIQIILTGNVLEINDTDTGNTEIGNGYSIVRKLRSESYIYCKSLLEEIINYLKQI